MLKVEHHIEHTADMNINHEFPFFLQHKHKIKQLFCNVGLIRLMLLEERNMV